MLRYRGFLLCMLLFAALTLGAQTNNWLWVSQAGGESVDYSKAMATDGNGNSYVAGYFSGTTTLGGISLTTNGGYDILIAKIDSNGNWLWAKKAGGTGADWALSLALDSNANVYVTGYFAESSTFGATTLQSNGNSDVFVTKLDSNGNWLWAKNAGGTGTDYGYSIAVDANFNVHIAGCFIGTANFGSTVLISSGSTDIFVTKLNSAGEWLSAIRAGGVSYDYAYSLAVDSQMNVYVTGIFQGTSIFGTTSLSSVGGYDLFVAKLDDNNNWLWAFRAGGSVSDWAFSIAVDSAHNVFITGSFIGTITFGSQNLNSTGNEDVFIAKMSSTGSWLWARKAGGTNVDYSLSLVLDNASNSYITGYYSGSATFGSTTLVSRGSSDAFFAKLSPTGDWLYANRIGGTSTDKGAAISLSGSSVYVTGSFYETAIFKATSATDSLMVTSAGAADFYVAKFGNPSSVDDPTNIQAVPFTLSQNYPNPFNPTTTISFDVRDEKAIYNLSIYDLKGRKVISLKQGMLSRGSHNVAWNGRDANNLEVASGVYFYRLDNGKDSISKKMILMK